MTDNRVSKTAGDASRRTVMSGIVGVGVGVPLLAACGSDDSESSAAAAAGAVTTAAVIGGGGDGGGGASASGAIGKTSEVPVGGAKIFKAEKVVVSQPNEGEFKAFSTICTHQGCAIPRSTGTRSSATATAAGSRSRTAPWSRARRPSRSRS